VRQGLFFLIDYVGNSRTAEDFGDRHHPRYFPDARKIDKPAVVAFEPEGHGGQRTDDAVFGAAEPHQTRSPGCTETTRLGPGHQSHLGTPGKLDQIRGNRAAGDGYPGVGSFNRLSGHDGASRLEQP
jgi:hypothetical protein